MKKYFKFLPFLLLSFCLVLNSCSQEEILDIDDNINAKSASIESSFEIESMLLSLSDYNLKDLDEESAQLLIEPIIDQTVSQLISEGISEQEIIEEFGSLKSPNLIHMSLAMVASDKVEVKADTVDCILRATGIQAIHEAFWGNFTNRRLLLRAVGRLATRAAGWIGAALIVADFVLCMNDN
ncbi:hypothetical protein BST92_03620 [Nonlabens arenilitoris]|uniref:Lipoprotein n=1 Tax=Nonlabens arenilitoris TaxID=1217969 RepID=A0A2S7U8Y5_9FLAO|nr:hypothetical protein [Nonlabens arenilitoris]PQJ31067.1 hypothetical protein BST92_03620 [Nonlabens arenilitoris]